MNKLLMKSVLPLVLLVSSFAFFSCEDDENVIGLDESAKYGNIKLTFEGERPDGEDFKETVNFRFMPSNGPQGSSTVEDDGDTYHSFDVMRLYNPFESGDENYAYLELNANTSEDEPTFNGSLDYVTTFITDDEAFFEWGDDFSLSTEDITEYSYNEDNGKLTVKFNVMTSGPNGQSMEITGEVKVTVFRQLYSDF